MVWKFFLLFLLLSTISHAFSKEDNFGGFNGKDFKHPSATIRVGSYPKEVILDKYYNQTELKELLQMLGKQYKNIMRVTSIGESDADRADIWAVQISHNVQKKRKLRKPMFKFVANTHGDEAVGYALMVSLIQYLVHNDLYDERVTKMLDAIDIWIVPTLNPDGLKRAKEGQCDSLDNFEGKYNGNGKDIDLDFDVNWEDNKGHLYQSETMNMLEFIERNPFVLSGNLKGGALVASYPQNHLYSTSSPDDEIFKILAQDYAFRNPRMRGGTACNESFPGGITIGNYLGKMGSGMQNFNYVRSNCFEINLFLSCCKYPPAKFLPFYWHENLMSMLNFIEKTRLGVQGRVMDRRRRPIRKAVITVSKDGRNCKSIKVTEMGEYWKVLLVPGVYHVAASAPGYGSKTFELNFNDTRSYVKYDFFLTLQGVWGTVTDCDGNPVRGAIISVQKTTGRNPFKNAKLPYRDSSAAEAGVVREFRGNGADGEFSVPLDLGAHYKITVSAPGYKSETRTVHMTAKNYYFHYEFVLQGEKHSWCP